MFLNMCYKKTFHVIQLFLLVIFRQYTCDDDVYIDKNFIVVKEHNTSFHQLIDISIFNKSDLSICTNSNSYYCVKWDAYAQFNVSKEPICKDYSYKSAKNVSLSVTFVLNKTHVYGGSERRVQKWPTESSTYTDFPFVTSKVESQSILEPLWLFSNGMYLFVDKETPLFISMNQSLDTFIITAKSKDPYFLKNETVLKYRLCKLPDLKAAYLHAVHNVITRPASIPDPDTVLQPIWSTWAVYKRDINDTVITDFISQIKNHSFPISHVEIDDKWEMCYGSLTISTTRFKDMKTLVTNMKKLKIKTTLWVHPFINVDCQPFHDDAKKNGYFVRNGVGTTVNWWNGEAGYIDFTNTKACEWFRKRLETLKNATGIDAFKFDAGESDWAPDSPIFNNSDISYPDSSLKNYVKIAASFGNMVEVRVGKSTQQFEIFVRMFDRDSTWDQNLGLATLIPTLLQMNMMGYPFVIPDMIGGDEYNNEVADEELFIRWLQVNVFMPTLQLSIPPWEYGSNAANIAMKMLKLRKTFSNLIIHSMKQFTEKGVPVNPPMWWIDPNDTETYTIDTQFMLGEDVVVAPILTKGAKSRDIYIPKGSWQDGNNKKAKNINGPKWLRNYSADLDTLPYFTRIKGASTDLKSSSIVCTSALGLIFLSYLIYYI